ncbi:MAG: DUF2207 domain-containing protein [Anaerococcus sp.]|uniref:DUF2207 domain-containing protein n=1 Tax=Anaerococcus nagyae TaxID=1755241 RepID=A0A3E2TG18_9FIRM|nr:MULTISPECIES: DUF2207 domain-containing protein [Anaerococcus]MDU2353186.1 DUF2207 domain-containing protein [Anaerococcus sp.]RGB74912.1 DUF2207 domain-containing protein [Anaerococcus nagyae]
MKKLKKAVNLLFLSFLVFIPQTVFAENFDHINIDVDVDKNGIGKVNEEWQIDERDNDFSERYKNIENLKGIKIEDFSVSMDGKNFSPKDPWNIDESFERKAYKYGRIDDNDNEVELCWGISKRNENNTYELKYKINPIIIGLNDSDMLFFEFVGARLDPKPNNFTIKINSYNPINENTKMWAFGYEGDINNKNGTIVAKTTGDISKGRILLKFPKGTFNTSYRENKIFDDYKDVAFEGANFEDTEGTAQLTDDDSDFPAFLVAIVTLFGIGLGAFGIKKAVDEANTYKFANIKEIPDIKNIKHYNFDQIPYEGNLEDLYLIAKNAYPNKTNFDNLINAFFLKWINEGAISFIEDKKDHGPFKKSLDQIEINHKLENMGQIEEDLFGYLIGAAYEKDSGKITESSLKKYMKKNHKSLENLSQRIDKSSLDTLISKGYVEKVTKAKARGKTKEELHLTEEGMDLYKNFVGFKNYLEDYENIDTKKIEDISILDKYMIFAALFGISEDAYDRFVNVNPDYAYYGFYNYHMIHHISNYSHATSTGGESSSFTGAGGSASFGGGAGGFGGGGGGGR